MWVADVIGRKMLLHPSDYSYQNSTTIWVHQPFTNWAPLPDYSVGTNEYRINAFPHFSLKIKSPNIQSKCYWKEEDDVLKIQNNEFVEEYGLPMPIIVILLRISQLRKTILGDKSVKTVENRANVARAE